jgi:DNA-binding FrmR family transcriptional regulator
MENNSRDVINQILAVKRSINEIMRDRLYIKDFAPKLMQNIYEADDLLQMFNVEILLVNIFNLFQRKPIFTSV